VGGEFGVGVAGGGSAGAVGLGVAVPDVGRRAEAPIGPRVGVVEGAIGAATDATPTVLVGVGAGEKIMGGASACFRRDAVVGSAAANRCWVGGAGVESFRPTTGSEAAVAAATPW
jgi:hypothetical protein